MLDTFDTYAVLIPNKCCGRFTFTIFIWLYPISVKSKTGQSMFCTVAVFVFLCSAPTTYLASKSILLNGKDILMEPYSTTVVKVTHQESQLTRKRKPKLYIFIYSLSRNSLEKIVHYLFLSVSLVLSFTLLLAILNCVCLFSPSVET